MLAGAVLGALEVGNSVAEFDEALRVIAECGPTVGTKDSPLPDFHIPVPSGPVERW